MIVQERLRQSIDEQQRRLRAGVPPDRQAAVLALLDAQDRRWQSPAIEPLPDLVTGRRHANLGGNKALHICLESTGDATAAPTSSGDRVDCWAERFLQECGWLAKAELVLAHCETGFMRMVDDGHGTFDAWVATKRTPTSWREGTDFDWWASWLARRHEPELRALRSGRADTAGSDPGHDTYYRQVANVHLKLMAYQLGYPPDAGIGGCTIQTYCDVLGGLSLGRSRHTTAGKRRRHDPSAPWLTRSLQTSPSIPLPSARPSPLSRSTGKMRPGTPPCPVSRRRRSFGSIRTGSPGRFTA